MKKIVLLLVLASLFSCKDTYYQLYNITSKDVKNENNNYSFENKDLKIAYDFWANKGEYNMAITNKSDQDVFIDLSRSHFILNGQATTYFQNKTAIESISVETAQRHSFFNSNTNNSNKTSVSKKYSTTTTDEAIICIPHDSYKKLNGFKICSMPYIDCNYKRYPKSKETKQLHFNANNTPLLFRNIISYRLNNFEANVQTIENTFWIDGIINLPKQDFFIKEKPIPCKESEIENKPLNLPKYISKNKFYIEYEGKKGNNDAPSYD